MPNWCITYIDIKHNDYQKLEELYDKIQEWTSNNYRENGFGTTWLGNVVLGSGVGTIDAGTETDFRCRGSLVWSELHECSINLVTETAWVPMIKMWQAVVDKYLPDAELFYLGDECGCGIYWTNNPKYVDRYSIDPYDFDSMEPQTNWSEEETSMFLRQLLITEERDINKLLNMFYESEWSDRMGIHKWNFVDICDCD